MRRNKILIAILFTFALLCAAQAWAVARFPPPDFESGYTQPQMTFPAPRAEWREWADLAVLLAALCVSSWIVIFKRSRRAMAALSIFSLAYFGFFRKGCVCPIGSIQNVAQCLANPAYMLPVTTALIFILPLFFALLFGRVFCGGVCPLGAIQDVPLVWPVRLPDWLDRALSVLPFVYLGLAVLFAATQTMFVVCRYDPFVVLFRMTGTFPILATGGALVVLSTFIGRPFCRFLCPYGALLGIFSRFAWRKPSISPERCVRCSLCHDVCPFGAIREPTPEGMEEPT